MGERELNWHRVADLDELPPGRVKTVTAGVHSMALANIDGEYTAMGNRCPHQGGPLGEGSIETGAEGQCWLRCPWHGWDFDPKTGLPPGGHEDSGQQLYPVDVREDGIYVGLEPEPPHQATISDLMVRTMTNWGVRSVFGMVGHSNLGLADGLRREAQQGRLSYYGIRHEGAAAFACSGYAKLTGKPAACLTIAGPGATNLLTGLWDARVDRAPVLALTGQVDMQVLGPGAFQEIDLAAAFAPVARFSQTVLHTSKHAELMTLACKNAIVERDVAHLIFPDDVQTLAAAESAQASGPEGRIARPSIAPDEQALADAIGLIEASKRPIVIVGYGARDAMAGVVALAERLRAPVLTTFKAKGQIPDQHPLAAGVLGRSGTPVASWFMNECDLILAFGASFSNHTGITPKRPIVQVDFDRMALGKFHSVAVPVWGEIGVTAKRLVNEVGDAARTVDQRPELAERWAIWREEKGPGRQFGRRVRRADRGRAGRRDHRGRCRQQHLLLRPLLRMPGPAGADVGLSRLDRFFLSRGDGRLGRDAGPGRVSGPQGRLGQRRRRLRAVPGRFYDGRQVQHGHHPRAAEQRAARQDLERAAGRRMAGLANRSAQPELRDVRQTLRNIRRPGQERRPDRGRNARRTGPGRTGAGGDHDGCRIGLTGVLLTAPADRGP
jgi:nitrite reductase/ring-hydroxylating ferredoxin subunit